ncbi:hypothetical protein YC2023_055927 [Brassica napus]
MISKRKRRWKKKKILVIQMKAKKQENERKRKLSNGDNVDLKEEESVLGSNQARMVPRNRHLLGLDRMEAGGRVSRDELLKLLWNVWSLGKHDDGQMSSSLITGDGNKESVHICTYKFCFHFTNYLHQPTILRNENSKYSELYMDKSNNYCSPNKNKSINNTKPKKIITNAEIIKGEDSLVRSEKKKKRSPLPLRHVAEKGTGCAEVAL